MHAYMIRRVQKLRPYRRSCVNKLLLQGAYSAYIRHCENDRGAGALKLSLTRCLTAIQLNLDLERLILAIYVYFANS